MTTHADEEMDDDGLTLLDIEHAILSGHIVERQEDRFTAESKYVIEGEAVGGDVMGVVAKLSPTDHVVIITVYLGNEDGPDDL